MGYAGYGIKVLKGIKSFFVVVPGTTVFHCFQELLRTKNTVIETLCF